MFSKKHIVTFYTVIGVVVLSGCAKHYMVATYSEPYGFLSGIWHGIVFPFSLVANLFSWFVSLVGISVFRDIQIIGRPNTGIFFYYIGFMLGLSAWGGSGAAGND
jgi:hypothetical protein